MPKAMLRLAALSAVAVAAATLAHAEVRPDGPALRAPAKLDCPAASADLTRTAQSPDGQWCDYAGQHGETVRLRLTPLNGQTPTEALAPLRVQLHGLVPVYRTATPVNYSAGDTADVNVPFVHVHKDGDRSEVRLFGISEATPGRPIQGEGYLAVLPAPGRAAVLLRAGTGAQAGGPLPPKPMIVAVDFDAAGDTVFSGLARPGQPLRLAVDGMASPEVRADAVGRFSVTLDKPLKAGTHSVVVQSQGAPAAPPVRFSITAAAPVSGLPFRGQRLAAGWRIDWLTPSGGEQTTLIMD